MLTNLNVTQVAADKWQLLTPLTAQGYIREENFPHIFSITVPAGFITDFASTPSIAWTIGMPKSGIYDAAAVVHDYLYVVGGKLGQLTYTKPEADLIFQELMRQLGVGQPKRWLMYQAVKLFGKGQF